ncbi:hypothetical protein DHODJN_25130 [Methylorubrum extorquens]
MSETMSEPQTRPYQPIEAYALLSNCEGCALVARDGGIDWACLKRFDADPSFSRLLDKTRGGHFTIRPTERFETVRQYLSRSNILETTFTTQTGFVTLHDFMVGPEGGTGRPLLVRLVTGVSGCVSMIAEYRPLAGFAEDFAPLAVEGHRVTAPGCPGLVAEADFAAEGELAAARFTLEGGQACGFALYLDTPPRPAPTPAS